MNLLPFTTTITSRDSTSQNAKFQDCHLEEPNINISAPFVIGRWCKYIASRYDICNHSIVVQNVSLWSTFPLSPLVYCIILPDNYVSAVLFSMTLICLGQRMLAGITFKAKENPYGTTVHALFQSHILGIPFRENRSSETRQIFREKCRKLYRRFKSVSCGHGFFLKQSTHMRCTETMYLDIMNGLLPGKPPNQILLTADKHI